MSWGTGYLSSHSGSLHPCKHIVLAFSGLCECDVINLWGTPIFFFWPLSTIPPGSTHSVCWLAAHISQCPGYRERGWSFCGCDNMVYCVSHMYQWGYGFSRRSQGSERRGSVPSWLSLAEKVLGLAQWTQPPSVIPGPFSVPLSPVEWTSLALAVQKQPHRAQNPSWAKRNSTGVGATWDQANPGEQCQTQLRSAVQKKTPEISSVTWMIYLPSLFCPSSLLFSD